jgi:hypothetical protein
MNEERDPLDIANQTTELFLKNSLANKKPEGPRATGHCLSCDAGVLPGIRWCDADCRDTWEKEQRNKGRKRK